MKKIIGIISLFSQLTVWSQSATSYQYLFNPLPINPAFTGYMDVLTASVQTRFQSLGLEGAPQSQSLVIHAPAPDLNAAFGLQFWNLTQGIDKQTGVYASYAYSVRSGDMKIAAGIRGGVDFQSADFSGLLTRQGNDPAFSQSAQIITPNVGVGIAVTSERLMASVSIPTMITSDLLSLSQRQYLLQGAYRFQLHSQITLQPSIFCRLSGEGLEEMIIGSSVDLLQVAGLGLFYNLNKQLASIIYLNLSDQFRLAYSGELPLSADQVSRFGSHEIGLHYLFRLTKRQSISPRYF